MKKSLTQQREVADECCLFRGIHLNKPLTPIGESPMAQLF